MKMLEFQGKEIFHRYGIPTPRGFSVASAGEVASRVKQEGLSFPLFVKAQIPAGGRGKAGGVRKVGSAAELEKAARDILGMELHGHRVRNVLVEEAIDAVSELYLGIVIDRSAGCPVIIASPDGGVDIESVPGERLLRISVDPLAGLMPYMGRAVAGFLGVPEAGKVLESLYSVFLDYECELAEINPLLLLEDGSVVAADARLDIDDEALCRHGDIEIPEGEISPLEAEARSDGITLVELEGEAGVIANGAGLTMATIDTLYLKGVRTGVFLDLGGTDSEDYVYRCFRLLGKSGARVIFLNMLGGITKGDTVARGLRRAIDDGHIKVPVVARIKGVALSPPEEILEGAGVTFADTTDEGAVAVADILGVK